MTEEVKGLKTLSLQADDGGSGVVQDPGFLGDTGSEGAEDPEFAGGRRWE